MAVEIPLTRGFVAIVDDADAPAVLKAGPWQAKPSGRTTYARRTVRRSVGRPTPLGLHTFLTGWPRVDHIDGDGLNNRRTNLRPATHRDNMRNRRPLGSNNTSGYKGVTWAKNRNRWCASIRYEDRHKHLGYYIDPADAARAYDAAAREMYGEFAHPTFPEGS